MIEPMPEDRKVELIDGCVRVAGELVVALREHGIDGINKVIAKIPDGGADVMYLVLAAMVDDQRSIRETLAWTEDMPAQVGRRTLADTRHAVEVARQQEQVRLVLAGVKTPAAVETLAPAVAVQQETIRDRMVRIAHRGQEVA